MIFERKCGTCHSIERTTSKKKSKHKWTKRVKKCAKRTDGWEDETKWINLGDIKAIAKYLARTQLRDKKKALPARGGSRIRAKLSTDSKIKTARDPNSLSAIEMVHIPVFKLPKMVFARERFKVGVKVADRNHPMLESHYIEWIEFYQDGLLLKKFDLKPGQEPKIKVTVEIGRVTDLRAVIKCTNHGFWQAHKQVRAR